MAVRRDNGWDTNREVYSPDQVEAVLREIGVEVREETQNDFLSFCPYHGNRDTPAFSTSKTRGYSICFNPSCAIGTEEPLTLERLVRKMTGASHFEAKRIVMFKKDDKPFTEIFDAVSVESLELPEFPPAAIDTMHNRLWETPEAVEYLHGRGLEDDTIRYFNMGFTPQSYKPIYKPDMVVVPAYDHRSRPVGLVGRTIVGKEFKNFGPGIKGDGFHKSKIIFNLNNARKHESIILTEACFDTARIHQAGYPNVGALLGGSLSAMQKELLKRHFTKIIIMTDDDDPIYPEHCRKCLNKGFDMCQGHQPGRDLGMKIASELPSMRVSWAAFDDKNVYARGVKDVSAMTDDEIRQSLRNSISHYEYLDWKVS